MLPLPERFSTTYEGMKTDTKLIQNCARGLKSMCVAQTLYAQSHKIRVYNESENAFNEPDLKTKTAKLFR